MLLGIDLGTSSLKATLFDPSESAAFGSEKEPVTVRTPTPDRAELDAEDVWQALLRVLARMRRAFPTEFAAVRGIGMSTIFPALVPMDADGRALHRCILYCDRRSVSQVEAIGRTVGLARYEALTGNRLTPGTTTLPGILWLRENAPDVFARTAVFGQVGTFLIRRLTGEFAVDSAQTSLSGLVRSGEEGTWCEEILGEVSLSSDRLPRLLAPAEVAGTVSAEGAAVSGLRKGTPVVAGCGDAPLAAFGGGVCRPRQLFCSAGTTDCLMVSGDRPSGNPTFCNTASPVPGLWVAIGTMSTAGASVKWFCEDFLGCTAAEMTARGAQAAPGAGGLVFLPYLQGERTPWWDPAARGVFFGLALTTGRNEACRAVFEGIACGWRQIISLLEAQYGTRAPEIISVGGGSTNPLLNRLKATLLNRPVRALRFTEITSLGAALIAGLGVGVFANPEEAVAATDCLRGGDVFDPVPDWREPLEKTYSLYENLYPSLKSLYGRATG